MERNINWKSWAGVASLSLALIAPVGAAPRGGGSRGGGGGRSAGAARGGGGGRSAGVARSSGGARASYSGRGAASYSAPRTHGAYVGGGEVAGRTFAAGNRVGAGGGYGGNWHGGGGRGGVWNGGHYGYWNGGLFIDLNAPFYGGPGYYGYPAYGGPAGGVYVHFHGTVQGVDANDGYLGVAADNGADYNVQTSSAASYGTGERIVVHGNDFGNTVIPTRLHEESVH